MTEPKSTLGKQIERQAQKARKRMVRERALLETDEFCRCLAINDKQLARLAAAGSVFSIEVEGVEYYPALLAKPGLDRRRLQSICRILVPAPSACRLGYLLSKRCSLSGLSPIEMLDDDKRYEWLRKMARAWAAEWSRTVVTVYLGEHESEAADNRPVLTAMQEIDPRVSIWRRATAAIHSGGYMWPLGPYPSAQTLTVFIDRIAAGTMQRIHEARVHVMVQDEFIRIRLTFRELAPREFETLSVPSAETVVDVAKKVISFLRKRMRTVRHSVQRK